MIPNVERLNRISIDLATWSERAERWQHRIPFDDPHEWKDYLARHVQDGLCQLCEIKDDGEVVGLFVYRIEELAAREMVVVAIYSFKTLGVDLVTFLDGCAEYIARKNGCLSIRCHTLRPGLIRKAHKIGYRTAEVVLRKEI